MRDNNSNFINLSKCPRYLALNPKDIRALLAEFGKREVIKIKDSLIPLKALFNTKKITQKIEPPRFDSYSFKSVPEAV